MQEIHTLAKNIRCLILDIDGVLTDGSLYYTDEGTQFKAFHCHDGQGIKMLQQSGVEVAIITKHDSPCINVRMNALGIKHVFQGQGDKLEAYTILKHRLNLEDEHFAYLGDDLPDVPVIKKVGLGMAVNNATGRVKEFAKWQTTINGGHGAAREVCELIMTAQGTLAEMEQCYFGE
ncbi:MAG: 3-deoxy-D-manno-octulosonate 8-phosphate phosphatase [Legionellales bacterium]|nr:3-deoxy-D-manno-octulosonate 8-phosphate phosphatase [Legionellales bacterium]|tara:strand:+ start:7683 stop:8210 length:528 start_codon:yes stop_codon:yes gene_type:complete